MFQQNNQSLKNQVQNFANEIKSSGRDPNQILNDAINSGKYSKAQIENAKNLARQFASILGIKEQ